jgi:hypothetical protein
LSIYLLLFSDQRKTPQRLERKQLMKVYSEKYLSPLEKLQGASLSRRLRCFSGRGSFDAAAHRHGFIFQRARVPP